MDPTSTIVASLPFVTENIPKFANTSQILGLNTVPLRHAGHDEQGWHISDFLAFKSLLDPRVTHHPENQIWLSAAAFGDVFNAYGKGYTHGHQHPKSVVGAAEDEKIITLPDPKELLNEFKKEMVRRAGTAKKAKSSLVLIVCGPVTAEQDIVFAQDDPENDGKALILTTDEIRATIGPDTHTILITSAVFSGGWLLNLHLTSRGLQAAEVTQSTLLSLLAQHCGGAFASDLLRTFTTRECPLLTGEERKSIRYAGPLEPLNSTREQKALLYSFQTKIQQSLAQKFASRGMQHEFVFEEGRYPWNKQPGRPAATFWSKYWDRLPDGTPSNKGNGFTFLGEAFGNSKASQIAHLRFVAKIDRATHLEEYTRPKLRERNRLIEAVEHFISQGGDQIQESHFRELFNVLEYRSAQIALTQMIVKCAKLPYPQDRAARYFSAAKEDALQMEDKAYRDAVTKAYRAIIDIKLFRPLSLDPELNQVALPDFQRPRDYICSALALQFTRAQAPAGDVADAMDAFVNSEVIPIKERVHKQQARMLTEVPAVVQAGVEWLVSIRLKKPVMGTVKKSEMTSSDSRASHKSAAATNVQDDPVGSTPGNAETSRGNILSAEAQTFRPQQESAEPTQALPKTEPGRSHSPTMSVDRDIREQLAKMTLKDENISQARSTELNQRASALGNEALPATSQTHKAASGVTAEQDPVAMLLELAKGDPEGFFKHMTQFVPRTAETGSSSLPEARDHGQQSPTTPRAAGKSIPEPGHAPAGERRENIPVVAPKDPENNATERAFNWAKVKW